ncbi:hypothetical protein NSQ62_08080 [Solibacillus sp. FSL H8-0523]|uniref:hypothetical protein n=1 Tax=Solibacillus sp. FSL H8-0523 TaxID=2954511 RepID=UPI003100C0FE
MSVMPISEKHFITVANSISELKYSHMPPLDWHEIVSLVTAWYEMNEHAYSERYRTHPDISLSPNFDKHASNESVDDVQLLKLLQCISYNTVDEVKSKKWIDARKKLDRIIEAVTDKIIREQTNYEIARWAI